MFGNSLHFAASRNGAKGPYRNNLTNFFVGGRLRPTQEEEAIAAVAQLLQHYPHQYVRLFSINPGTRQRGRDLVIQQPDTL